MPIARTTITDRKGRSIVAVRGKLPPKPVPETSPAHDGPRNWREAGDLLDRLAAMIRRIPPPGGPNPTAFHEAKSEAQRLAQRLGDWTRRQKD